jgi:hypothetical protein
MPRLQPSSSTTNPAIEKLKSKGVKLPEIRNTPVWEGPSGEGPNGGISFSLLSRWLSCRERFRLRVVEGLRHAEDFNHRMEFGNLWHTAEQVHAAKPMTREPGWEHAIADYARDLAKKYPTQAQQVDHWYNVCRVTFPEYVRYWEAHPDVMERTPLLAEQVFDVPYTLPSGRTVRLRGKWDSVDLVGRGKSARVWLMENKTKGEVDEKKIRRQITFDLQVMLYLVALRFCNDGSPGLSPLDNYTEFQNNKIAGVRYNVVRRPLSGGKGSIVRHKPTKANPIGESKDEYYERLRGIIRESPENYFFRWNVTITEKDILRFRRECLDPILETLSDWWSWINDPMSKDPYRGGGGSVNRWGIHWRHPYGVDNPLDAGYESDLDYYLEGGDDIGLVRTDDLFGELR